MTKRPLCLTVFIFFINNYSQGDADPLANPFIHEGSIGKSTRDEYKFLPTLEIDEWVGEDFIFLPRSSRELQIYPYQSFKPNLSYHKWVGKTLTAESIKHGDYPVVVFRSADGKKVSGTVYAGQLKGIAPLRDLLYARTKWLGKTLWFNGTQLVTWDEEKEEYGSIKLIKFSPVVVEDVVASWREDAAVRLILRKPGDGVGFADVNLSGTNIELLSRGYNHFEDKFLEYDPREKYNWSKQVWNAIENEKVFIGMTGEQASFSWGKPKTVNRTSTKNERKEQWVYQSGSYLYLVNGVITAIQN